MRLKQYGIRSGNLNILYLIKRWASSSDVPPELMAKLRSINIHSTYKDSQGVSKKSTNLIPPPSPKVGNTANSRNADTGVICHELDRNGAINLHGEKLQKISLCTSLGLLPRDLRKLDGTLNQLPIILVRDSAILINIEDIQAILKFNGVILFEDVNDLERRMRQSDFILYLQNRLKSQDPTQGPFEFIVLESILQRTLQALQDEFEGMQPEIEEHLRALENIVHWERLKILLTLRKRVTRFLEQVNNIRNCLKELLESDADMADMYLSEKHDANIIDRPSYAHEEMELLLENYLKMAEDIVSRTQVLMSNMQATEDIINIALVGQRNELVLLDLRLGIGTFAASMGGFGASVLGMNLHNGYENSQLAFWFVLGTLISISSTSFILVWRRMLRLIHRN